jgi:glycosyltransferase involved in cell wall biosynthesis
MIPLRVLLMTDEATVGGGQRQLLALAERMDPARFEVGVACPTEGYLVDEIRLRRIRHVPLNLPNYPSLTAIARTFGALRRFRPDILHTHGGTAGFYGRCAGGMIPGIRIVHTYHGIHYLNFTPGIRRLTYTFIDKLLLRSTDIVICVGQGDYRAGLVAGVVNEKKSVVITNGIDVQKFAHKRKSVRRQVIGTIGRLHIQKGQIYLLEAMQHVLASEPSAILRIIGDGELMNYLKNSAQSLGLSGHIEFAGMRNDVAEELAAMEIFVLPSLWEGFPLVLLEAMAAERPIVATRVNGVTEILEDGVDSILVPPRNPKALADAVLVFLRSRSLAVQYAKRAGHKVRDLFTVETMIEKTQQVYEHVGTKAAREA